MINIIIHRYEISPLLMSDNGVHEEYLAGVVKILSFILTGVLH